ncbi:MAG TPA: hypothetical protein VKB23_12370 [Solirubrobacterales bacterium]|nr:hypothetical protein [Solirubrobacterales bacterium]
MRVLLRARGQTVAEEDVGGPLMIRPGGMKVVSGSGSDLVLELEQSGTEVPDMLVGEVPLVWWNPVERSVDVSFVKVKPAAPFTKEDVATMWSRLVSTSLRGLTLPPGQGRDQGPRPGRGDWLRPEAVPNARAACRHMLANWPEQERVVPVWAPADMRGAPEDLIETERRGGSRPGREVGGALIPDKVAKRHRSTAPWASAALAAACRSLVKAVEERLASPSQATALVRPMREVAERAGVSRAVDPSRSSWPPIAREVFAAVLGARISLSLGNDPTGLVPLSNVWRLYEGWLAIAVADALKPLLGEGSELPGKTRWGWGWSCGSALVRVRAQAEIKADANAELAGHPDGLLSVLSNLKPDVLVTVCDPAGGQAVLCVEAKRRTTATSMEASEVAEAGAKYAWGIRSGADPATPIASVIVASSAQLPAMHDEDEGRLSASFLLPSQGRAAFEDSVRQRVKALLAEVAPS